MRTTILMLFLWAQADASILRYTASGVWGPDVPVNMWMSPNKPWSLTFIASSQPTLSNIILVNGQWNFDIPFTAFEYDLGGVPVVANPIAIRIEDYLNSEGPGLFVYFARYPVYSPSNPSTFDAPPFTGFVLVTDPLTNLYAIGPNLLPELLTGVFPLGDSPHVWRSALRVDDSTTALIGNALLTVETIPEPSTAFLVWTGLSLVAVGACRSRRARQ